MPWTPELSDFKLGYIDCQYIGEMSQDKLH